MIECHTLIYVTDDFARVKLQEIEGVDGSDYVNASYIDVRILVYSSPVISLEKVIGSKCTYCLFCDVLESVLNLLILLRTCI